MSAKAPRMRPPGAAKPPAPPAPPPSNLVEPLATLIDALTAEGGGFKVLPSGRIETFLPMSEGWRRRYYDRRSGEGQAEAVRRALGLTLQAATLEDLSRLVYSSLV